MTIELKPAMPAVTLDAVLGGLETFRNGCNFRVKFDGHDAYLEYGCYGVHVNLMQGMERMLHDWYTAGLPDGYDFAPKFYHLPKLLPISEETKIALMKRKPCECCGAPWFNPHNDQADRRGFIASVSGGLLWHVGG
jgi:hypothetical protein